MDAVRARSLHPIRIARRAPLQAVGAVGLRHPLPRRPEAVPPAAATDACRRTRPGVRHDRDSVLTAGSRTRAESDACAPYRRNMTGICGVTLANVTRFRISDAARLLAVSDDSVRRWISQGRLPVVEGPGPQLVEGTDLAALALELGEGAVPESGGPLTPTSARNRFPGIVTAVKKDTVMAQVDVQAGPFRIVSLISAEAVEQLGLDVGVETVATVKATNVVLQTPSSR